jgi:hypothetical protein
MIGSDRASPKGVVVSSFFRAARRIAENPATRDMVKQQVDRVTRTTESSGAAERGAGAILGALANGKASLSALNELGRQLQSRGSWLNGLQQLVSQQSSDQLKSVANQAVSALPQSVRTDLLARLTRQTDHLPGAAAEDLTGAITGFLGKGDGIQQLLGALVAGKGNGPAGSLDLVTAMKDPSVRELARSLTSALISSKTRDLL